MSMKNLEKKIKKFQKLKANRPADARSQPSSRQHTSHSWSPRRCSARCPSADSRPSLTPMSGADFAKRHEEAERVHSLRVAMRAANAAKPTGTKAIAPSQSKSGSSEIRMLI